jgi:DNA repair photolyase
MPLESRCRLTRRILEILLERGVSTILSTKSNAPAFYEDLDLFRRFGEKLIICVGQANLAHLQGSTDPRELPNSRAANQLARLGIPVWVFITPVLPGITDVKPMIDALPADIPVFLDKLRLTPDSAYKQRFFHHLRAGFPSLEPRYRALMQTGADPYYQELKEMYQADARVKFVFGEN